jgi:hypothetical protein
MQMMADDYADTKSVAEPPRGDSQGQTHRSKQGIDSAESQDLFAKTSE